MWPRSYKLRFELEEKEKKYQELRSESVNEIIAYRPNWLIRYGTFMFSFFFLFLFIATFSIRYPDLIRSTLILSSNQSPKSVVSKIDGKLLKLFIKENDKVSKGQILAYMESTANPEHVINLGLLLDKTKEQVNQGDLSTLSSFKTLQNLNLGELQGDFQTFEQSLTKLQSLTTNGFYIQNKQFLKNELFQLKNLSDKLHEQKQIFQRDYDLARGEFNTQQRLAKQGHISSLELTREESKMLARQLALKQVEATLINNLNEQSLKNKELLELDKSLFEQENYTKEALNTLISNVNIWKNKYLIKAEQDGRVFFQKTLQENQVLKANQEMFFIGNGMPFNYIGEMKVAQDNFGKIKIGQNVITKFNSYPSEEFGTVNGKVEFISQIPEADNTYLVKIKFPNGLTTNYKKKLSFRNGMQATADIILEDKSLADKILHNFKKAIKR